MIAPIIKPKKIGRNEPCPCGKTDDAGKVLKYKKCCMPKAEANQKLNQAGMWAIMRKLIKESKEGKVEITYNELQQIPSDEGIMTHFDLDEDKFKLTVVKVKKSNILTADKRIKI
jgi:hypothetical protein